MAVSGVVASHSGPAAAGRRGVRLAGLPCEVAQLVELEEPGRAWLPGPQLQPLRRVPVEEPVATPRRAHRGTTAGSFPRRDADLDSPAIHAAAPDAVMSTARMSFQSWSTA